MRIRHTVGADQSVVVEVIVRTVIFVEVATVAIDIHPVLVLPVARLIYEVPDKPTLVFRILADDVPVFFESAFRVAHGVCVFTLNQRFLNIAFAVFDTALVAQIHRAINICKFTGACLLVLYGACLVLVLDPSVAFFKVRSHAGFVAQRPEDDGRVVVAALHIALVAFHVCLGVNRILCQCLVAISHAVRFYVGFGHDVETVLVAKVIPAVVVRIVASTYSIDIKLFHYFDIL